MVVNNSDPFHAGSALNITVFYIFYFIELIQGNWRLKISWDSFYIIYELLPLKFSLTEIHDGALTEYKKLTFEKMCD